MVSFIRQLKRNIVISAGIFLPDNLALSLYERIFDSKRFSKSFLGKMILLTIARKGIKNEVNRKIDIEGNIQSYLFV